MIALNKTLDPEQDYAELAPELVIVDRHFHSAREQHHHRRFEYAMALRAYDTWAQQDYEHYGHANRTHGGAIYDIGGAGSPFPLMLEPQIVRVIDPDENYPLAHFVRYARLGSAVFCLSVLEHVDDLDQFLYHLSCLTAPGGLLFLTFDFCDGFYDPRTRAVPDTYHFHWMRKRIFNIFAISLMLQSFITRDFNIFGDFDETYHGNQVYDYSFHSLALVKKP